MKKILGIYVAIWVLCLALFNVLAFLVPALPTFPKYEAGFWIGYAVTTVAYIANLFASIEFMRGNERKDAERRLFHIPLVQKSVTSLAIMTVIGGLCVAVSAIPAYIGAILCVAVVVFYIISTLKANIAVSEVERIGENVRQKTQFVKLLTVAADSLNKSTSATELKALTNKVYEAIRYSDPVSGVELNEIESTIKSTFDDFAQAVAENDLEKATSLCNTILSQVAERNTICKASK